MQLHSFHLSGHSHRVRLFMSLLDIPFENIEVDVRSRAQRSEEHLRLNSFGQVPVLVDGDIVVSDSTAILVYLAKKCGATSWLPETPHEAAEVQRWLSVASNEIASGPALARSILLFNLPRSAEEPIAKSHAVLKVIEARLTDRQWIATAAPTIADVALYAYIAHASEGNVDTTIYSNVLAWLGRIESLPGFVPFARSPIGLSATTIRPTK